MGAMRRGAVVAGATAPSPADLAARREQLAAAAEARLKASQRQQQLWG